MTYFNYFTEIEEEFVKRRGSHLLVSPLDWSLIEMWKQRDIPLHVVLRGINSSFDSYEGKARRGRKINSLFYCQQEVEAMFQEYLESRVGGNSTGQTSESNGNGAGSGGDQFSPSTLIDYLGEQRQALESLKQKQKAHPQLGEVIERAVDRLDQIIGDLRTSGRISPEDLEKDLTTVENLLLEGLRESAGAELLTELKKEGSSQLKMYKQTMEREMFEQTVVNFVDRRLREIYSVPRLSLFYL